MTMNANETPQICPINGCNRPARRSGNDNYCNHHHKARQRARLRAAREAAECEAALDRQVLADELCALSASDLALRLAESECLGGAVFVTCEHDPGLTGYYYSLSHSIDGGDDIFLTHYSRLHGPICDDVCGPYATVADITRDHEDAMHDDTFRANAIQALVDSAAIAKATTE